MLAEMLAQQHAAGQRVVGRLVAMQSHPFKAAAALPMSRLPCSVSQNGFDAFGMLFKNSGRRPKGEEPPRSIRAAFLGIFLARPRFPFSCVSKLLPHVKGDRSNSAQEGQIEGLLRACVQGSERRERHGPFCTRSQKHQPKL